MMPYPPSHTERPTRWPLFALIFAAILAGTSLLMVGCQSSDDDGQANAYRATHRTQLIGGPGALGEVGDWVLENDQIRVVIQDATFNRGTGLFGGSLIDADIVRQDGQGDPFGGNGRDSFGEAFPAYFLEVIDPEEIVIVNDGADGEAAVLEVRGSGGEFVTMLRFFNQAMVNAYDADLSELTGGGMPSSDGEPNVRFTARYILEPGARHVRVESELTNIDDGTQRFPSSLVTQLAGLLIDGGDIDFDDFTVPTGTALGFGAMNDLFLPGLGYDIRFGLEDIYNTQEINLPALPGHITDVLATSSTDGISYGFATAPDPENNFVYNKPDYYGEDVSPTDMLFLFEAAGYGGAFTHEIPEELAPGESFAAINYFVVGSGDVASIRDEVYKIHGTETHTVTGRLFDEVTGSAAGQHAKLLFYEARESSCAADDEPYAFNQAFTNTEGYFELQLPPGQYCYRTRYQGATGDYRSFEVDDGPVNLQAPFPSAGRIEAFVVDQTGNPIPAKMTIVGEYEPQQNPETGNFDLDTRQYLFDLAAGERWRTSESVNFDPDDDSPRRFIETIEFSTADGRASATAEPGQYSAFFSRGAEYELVERPIEVEPGGVTRLNVQIERQINPEGYLSGDYHMHAAGSIDSGLDYNDRVISIAGEGVEVVVSSDHNYISDYMPYIHRNNLQPFLRSIVGLELTSMEAGHFNAFPLRQDIASQNRGSVAWQNIPPDEIFANLREMGSLEDPEDTIIQVNHPRDSILGYFNQHYLDALTGVADLPINTVDGGGIDRATVAAMSPSGPAFAKSGDDCPPDHDGQYCSAFDYDFDAIEIYNGKRIHLLHHFRMPEHDTLSDDAIQHFVDQAREAAEEDDDQEFDEDGYELEDILPPANTILCDDGDVAFAGGLDDWYNFLNYRRPNGEYKTYTATGNSDSHHYGSPDDPEPGFPKNYFWAGHNDLQNMTPAELAEALHSNHNIVTNGPFITMSIDGQPLGSTVHVDDGQVTLSLEAQAADWVVGDHPLTFDIIANGERIIEDMVIELEDNRWEDEITIDLDDYSFIHHAEDGIRDTWFVVEVEGENNLFPVVQPAEIPQVPFDEALGAIAEPFGFGETVEGLAPSEELDISPIAFTNPIWVIDDANGPERSEFEPPEPPHRACVGNELETGSMEVGAIDDFVPFGDRRLDAVNAPVKHDHGPSLIDREPGELRDVRALFDHWHDH